MLCFCSCVSEPEEVTFFNPDQEFIIDLNQKLSPDGPHLVFEIYSVDRFNCLNAHINSDLHLSENSIDLNIENFEIPENCSVITNADGGIINTEVATGNTSIFLESFIYNMTVSADDLFHNTGFLYAQNNKYSLELNTNDGITIGRSSIYKIPDNHAWGWINTQGTSVDILDGLSPFVHKSSSLNPGDYGLFTINGNDHLSIIDTPQNLETTFIYEVDNEDGLRDYVQYIKENYSDLELEITLSNGDQF